MTTDRIFYSMPSTVHLEIVYYSLCLRISGDYTGSERLLRYIIIGNMCSMMILMMPFTVSERVCHYGGRNIALEEELPYFVLAFSLV